MLQLHSLFLFGFLASTAHAQVTIQAPTLTQCESTTISWSGGTSPYMIYIYPESYLSESSFYDTIGPIDGTSTSYLVNVPSGQKLKFNVRDSANPAYEGSAFTDAIDIGSGSDISCLATGPIGTGGIPQLPSATGVPSGFGSFSAPSIAPFPGSAVGASTSVSTGSASVTSSARASSSAAAASSSTPSASITGPRNGDGPSTDVPDAGSAGYGLSSGWVFFATFAAMGLAM